MMATQESKFVDFYVTYAPVGVAVLAIGIAFSPLASPKPVSPQVWERRVEEDLRKVAAEQYKEME